MPELAEVEYYRKRWHQAGVRQRIREVELHAQAKVFRGIDPVRLRPELAGTVLRGSSAAAKQMLFRFGGDRWLGIHLGMSGELTAQAPGFRPGKHDHLVLRTRRGALVFTDPRMFGRIQFHRGTKPPSWWTDIAPPILSQPFTATAVAAFLRRRARAPIKAVLLMQEQFPGIGNWMADEILWRAAIHPRRTAGSLRPDEVRTLWRECRRVCRLALDTVAGRGSALPRDLNVNIPTNWLFRHRWEAGGRCPRTGARLVREQIGGRTTCWSPARQKRPDPRAGRRTSRRRTTATRKAAP